MSGTEFVLVDAVQTGDLAKVREALSSGCSADERDVSGHTALMVAALKGDVPVAQALLEAGASPNRRTTDREETVLHLLAREPSGAGVMKALLGGSVRLERRDRFGWTPLMVAAHTGSVGSVQCLVDAGADISARTSDGRTVADLAEQAGHADVITLLQASLPN